MYAITRERNGNRFPMQIYCLCIVCQVQAPIVNHFRQLTTPSKNGLHPFHLECDATKRIGKVRRKEHTAFKYEKPTDSLCIAKNRIMLTDRQVMKISLSNWSVAMMSRRWVRITLSLHLSWAANGITNFSHSMSEMPPIGGGNGADWARTFKLQFVTEYLGVHPVFYNTRYYSVSLRYRNQHYSVFVLFFCLWEKQKSTKARLI